MSFSVGDFAMMGIGNILFAEGKDFTCEKESELIAANNAGAAFIFGYSLLILLYSGMLWYVFYHIPSKFGLIYKRND
jgi:hypothetical protein